MSIEVRPFREGDWPAVWRILEPTIRAGETYTLPRDMTEDAARAYWTAPVNAVFVAEDGDEVVGTYYMKANQMGGGAHVANCGYMTLASAAGKGMARAMCAHSLEAARGKGFKAMQFNFVVATNERAVKLWESLGFEIVGRLPKAFDHPLHGLVDANVMYRSL